MTDFVNGLEWEPANCDGDGSSIIGTPPGKAVLWPGARIAGLDPDGEPDWTSLEPTEPPVTVRIDVEVGGEIAGGR